MWSYGTGWYNNAALRINVNGVDRMPNARLASGETGTHTFTVNHGDDVRFYWVNGGSTYDYQCAFAVWYTDEPPVPAFNPNAASWSPSDDPQGKVLAYLQYRPSGGAIGNGTPMGDFTARVEMEFDFNTPITGNMVLRAKWMPIPSGVTISSTHIFTAQGLELAFLATVTPQGAPQQVTWSVAGNDKASFDGNILKVAADAKPGAITVKVAVNGYSGFTDERNITILPSTANAAGGNHTAAIKSDGSLWSWGINNAGLLGINNFIPTESRVPVQEYSKSTWVSVSAGGYHTAAIKSDGSLWSWGNNSYGRLGNNSTVNSPVPVQEYSKSTWVSVSAGKFHTAAIKSDGSLWSWGNNSYGLLGNNSTATESPVPVQEYSKSTWVSVSAGGFHTAAIKSDGSLWAWGYNQSGVLGSNLSIEESRVPVQEYSRSTWVSVAAGNSHTAAIKSDGSLWSWGSNSDGRLGNNSTVDSPVPVQEYSKSTWVSVSADLYHTAAIKSDGTLWSWGTNSYYGQLGNDSTVASRIPVQEYSTSTWASVSAGNEYTVAIKSDGSLWAWGRNYYGQLGNTAISTGNYSGSRVPVRESSNSTWRKYPR